MPLLPLFDDIPDQSGKVVIVTGGNSGIGKVTCKVLAARGAKVYMGARNKERAEEAMEEIKRDIGREDNLVWLPMDLASLASIRDAVEHFKSQENDLHMLVNNAGIMAVPFAHTTDGYESQWGTNVVGHFALIKGLLPTLEHTASHTPSGTVRVINVSSEAHNLAPSGGINFEDLQLKDAWFAEWRRYGQSKLGNILLTKEITRRYSDKGIISVAVHPGVIYTKLHTSVNQSWKVTLPLKIPTKKISEEEGGYTQIFAATHPRVISDDLNGKYLQPMAQIGKPSAYSQDPKLAEKMWDYLEKDLAGKA